MSNRYVMNFGNEVLIGVGWCCLRRPVDTALKPVRACAAGVASSYLAASYSAWRVSSALWIDESLITLCQRVRLQRGRTSFFIILVPMNGRIKSAMTVRGGYGLVVDLTCSPSPLIPLPSRERGNAVVLSCRLRRPVDTALKPV